MFPLQSFPPSNTFFFPPSFLLIFFPPFIFFFPTFILQIIGLAFCGRAVHPVGSSQFCAFVLLPLHAWTFKPTKPREEKKKGKSKRATLKHVRKHHRKTQKTHAGLDIGTHKTAKPIRGCIVCANCRDKQLILGDLFLFLWMSLADQVSVTFKDGARTEHTHTHTHYQTKTWPSSGVAKVWRSVQPHVFAILHYTFPFDIRALTYSLQRKLLYYYNICQKPGRRKTKIEYAGSLSANVQCLQIFHQIGTTTSGCKETFSVNCFLFQ